MFALFLLPMGDPKRDRQDWADALATVTNGIHRGDQSHHLYTPDARKKPEPTAVANGPRSADDACIRHVDEILWLQ